MGFVWRRSLFRHNKILRSSRLEEQELNMFRKRKCQGKTRRRKNWSLNVNKIWFSTELIAPELKEKLSTFLHRSSCVFIFCKLFLRSFQCISSFVFLIIFFENPHLANVEHTNKPKRCIMKTNGWKVNRTRVATKSVSTQENWLTWVWTGVEVKDYKGESISWKGTPSRLEKNFDETHVQLKWWVTNNWELLTIILSYNGLFLA